MKAYTKLDMAYALGCSTKTIEDDSAHLGITPAKGDRNLNLYNERDFNLISQMREHCSNKQNSRDSFVPITVPELVEDEVKITKLTQNDSSNSINNFEKSLEVGLSADPFFDLELLQRISDRSWLLPAQRLAPILGIKPKYLNTLKQYNYCGFIATKEIYAHNRALWKIESKNS